MNWQRFFTASAAVFLVGMIMGFLIHGQLLEADYRGLGPLMRSPADAQAHFPYMVLAFVFFAVAFVWLYAKGVEEKPWLGQGLRFGLVTWLFGAVSVFLTYYAVEPLPASLVCKQIGFESVDFLLLGVVVAALYRKS
jgi:hypothetical protein